jgi:endogenous inhibitor of DNA gyrase (YacG/DUF329 family)
MKRKGEEVPCAYCSKLFYRAPGRSGNRKFCSAECGHKAWKVQKIEKPCETCGAAMTVYPSQHSARKFCSKACQYVGRIQRPVGRMHNGKPVREMNDGYLKIWEPEHPFNNKGWVLEHRWLMEQQLGRYLTRDEEVDHINDVRNDNRLENLQVLSKSDHRRKTGNGARAKRLTMREQLAEYERRFGPLT